jgi:hypothetical protein
VCCINNFRSTDRSSLNHILYTVRKPTLPNTVRGGPAASLIILQRFRNNCDHFLGHQTIPAYSWPADDTATCSSAWQQNGFTLACPGSVYSCSLRGSTRCYLLFQSMQVTRREKTLFGAHNFYNLTYFLYGSLLYLFSYQKISLILKL